MLASTTCLVTGCSSGIGNALARALSDAGARVWATARRPEDLADLEADVEGILALDVTAPDQVAEVLERIGELDILINNAGYGLEGAVEEISDSELQNVFETNVFGTWRMCRAALPTMRERGWGVIVNVSSFGGEVPFPGMGAYRASKFAVQCLSWTLHLEVAAFGIRVLDVQPGLVASGFGQRMVQAQAMGPNSPYVPMHEAAARAYPAMSPVALSPEQVAAAIVAELETPSGRLRVPVGEDAERMIAAVRAGDDHFERYLVDQIGFNWHPGSSGRRAA